MKKIVLLPVLAVSMVSLLVGCGKQEDVQPNTEPVIEETHQSVLNPTVNTEQEEIHLEDLHIHDPEEIDTSSIRYMWDEPYLSPDIFTVRLDQDWTNSIKVGDIAVNADTMTSFGEIPNFFFSDQEKTDQRITLETLYQSTLYNEPFVAEFHDGTRAIDGEFILYGAHKDANAIVNCVELKMHMTSQNKDLYRELSSYDNLIGLGNTQAHVESVLSDFQGLTANDSGLQKDVIYDDVAVSMTLSYTKLSADFADNLDENEQWILTGIKWFPNEVNLALK